MPKLSPWPIALAVLDPGRPSGTRAQQYRTATDRLAEAALDGALLAAPVLVALCYVKHWELRYRGGSDLLAQLQGPEVPRLLRSLAPYSGDWLEGLLAVPLLLVLVTWPKHTGPHRWLQLAVLETLLGLVAAGWGALILVGRIPGPGLIGDFLRAAARDPALVDPRASLPPGTWLRMAGMLALGPAALAARAVVGRPAGWRHRRALALGLVVVPLGLRILVAPATEPGTRPLQRGLFERMVRAIITPEPAPETGAPLTPATILAGYAEAVGQHPSAAPAPAPRGVRVPPGPRPSNLVMVILETAPYRDYPLDDPARFPSLRPLLEHSLIAHEHYATGPSSSRSDFALFSSLYDGPGMTSPLRALYLKQPARRLDALPGILAGRGYATRYYYPASFTLPEDEWFVRWAGFGSVRHRPTKGVYRMQAPEARVQAERDLFATAMAELPSGPDNGPFLVVIRSLIGHYPILDPAAASRGGGERPSLALRRQALVQLQDSLLGELLSTLKQRRLLDNTILLVTGDHGYRTQAEDPTAELGLLNRVTFHVPFIIYDRRAFPAPFHVRLPTSHVDVVPTLLALTGLAGDRYLHFGRPVWDPGLGLRTVCVSSEFQGGMSGCVRGGRYYMQSPDGELGFLSSAFRFSPADLIVPGRSTPADLDAARAFRRSLAQLGQVREGWLRYLMER